MATIGMAARFPGCHGNGSNEQLGRFVFLFFLRLGLCWIHFSCKRMGQKIWQFDSSSLNEFRNAEMLNGCFTSFLVKFHFSKAFKVFSSALNSCTLVWMPACPTGIGPWSVRAWIWLRRCPSNDGTMSSTMIQIPQHLERCNWADDHSINEDIFFFGL